MHLDKEALDAHESRWRAQLINAVAGFKPVNLIGTIDDQGRTNLAIITSVVHLGANPPLLGMVIRPSPKGVERHTLNNILDTGAFSVNAVTEDMVPQAHQTSARYSGETSEFEATGLTPRWIDGRREPFVAESPLQIGLSLLEHLPLKHNGTHFIIGNIDCIDIPDNAVADDGTVDLGALRLVTACGLDTYHSVGSGTRFAYAKPDQPPRPI
ncbi:conserved hypothetical protein [Luminiphilus syltensis NOR5-1B]|uniref:Flavin reductase like domain-containing protein n=1 Tax=Luminiphilus syltensis NOR5-1B TaxID=565045 RepID=B8KSE8_9GAMM|nr:flavin reductase family protein [Luminiphilus syltensis]EED36011.1 conserved hypothetical protein [Luminiphilus syltensis NOR5-1B]